LELNCSTNTGRYMKEINMTKPEILPCREAFEEWIKKSHGSVKLDENGNYRDTPTHLAWMGWINAWERAPQASEWLDISSAPKDGTYVLLYQPDTLIPDIVVCAWEDDWWQCCDGKNPELPLRGHSPTHWIPLPAPPRISTPTKGGEDESRR